MDSEVKGTVEIERLNGRQFHFEITNHAAQSTTNIFLDAEAMEELADLMNRVREGDLAACTMEVDRTGAELV